MKNIIYIGLSIFGFVHLNAQTVSDALAFSTENINGTARYQSMAGAFGALGADMTGFTVNPAGSALFLNNQMGFSLSTNTKNNDANYYNSFYSNSKTKLNLNQAGMVFVFKNRNTNDDWKKISLGINYENTYNHNNQFIAFGTNPTNSISNYFLSYANANSSLNQGGILLSSIENSTYYQLPYADQQAFLGYEGYIINAADENNANNTVYTSNTPIGGNYYQEYTETVTGSNGKLAFNIGTSYKDKLYFGLNLNSHFVNYQKSTVFYEDNENLNNNTYDLVAVRFDNNTYTYGSGFSFQMGAIAKLNQNVRLGLTYDSSTWYNLNDEIKQNLITLINDNSAGIATGTTTINPDSNNYIIYDTYRVKTPAKVTASIASVFNKKGLLSLDYSFKDYSNIVYSIERDSRNAFINSDINNNLKGVSQIRVGGEYIIDNVSIRAGYRFEESPYADKSILGNTNGVSAGVGFKFGGTKLDFSFATSSQDGFKNFFDRGFTDGATNATTVSNLTASLIFAL
jgi:hypothetical protein